MAEKPAIDPRNLKAFNKALQEYAKWNARELGPLVQNRGQRVKWALYRIFKSIAPERGELEAELDALGGRMKRRKVKGKTLTAKQERRKRLSSRNYLSVSFLLREWRYSREGQNVKRDQFNRIRRKIGQVIDRTAKGVRRPSVEITSFLEGAAKQNAQRGLVNRALAQQTADMKTYIVRKQKQKQAQTIAKLNQFTKGIAE